MRAHFILALRRLAAKLRVREAEAALQAHLDMAVAAEGEAPPAALCLAIAQRRAALAQARAHYNALLPVGRRVIWRSA